MAATEACASPQKLSAPAFPTEDVVKTAFVDVDADQDGLISLVECNAAVKQMGCPIEVSEDRFNEADANKDGKLSCEEFLSLMPKQS